VGNARALKDAVKDPLVKKEKAAPKTKKNHPHLNRLLISVVASLIGGFLGGVAATRFFKIRF
jgi:hypothetical protein